MDNSSTFQENEYVKKASENVEKYRIYRQMINEFYQEDEKSSKTTLSKQEKIKIEPTIIIENDRTIKVEFKIGNKLNSLNKQMYRIQNLIDFYNKFERQEVGKYGKKLEFVHTRENVYEQDQKTLDFILKYAKIMKYANFASNRYYLNMLNNSFIVLEENGIDDLFDTFNSKEVNFVYEKEPYERLKFIDHEPDIKFILQNKSRYEFELLTTADIYDYALFKGKDYTYFLKENRLFKCSKDFDSSVLKILETFRVNFTRSIIFNKFEFSSFYSLVMPKIGKNLVISEISEEELSKYRPKDLKVKVYLDYDKKGYIVADIRFIYDNIEFNPFEKVEKNVPRNAHEESNVLDLFNEAGFLFDKKTNKLLMIDDEKIYTFLKDTIIEFVSQFEILATDEFKKKQIINPKLNVAQVKLENNLLNIDLTQINFDKKEIAEIMKKYKLKKKFHKLKSGDFIDLSQNEALDILQKLHEGTNISYEELTSEEAKLPIFRGMYLDKILEKSGILIRQNDEYRNLIDDIYNNKISDQIEIPKGLKATLREYQKVGYMWLKTLDGYGLGGILADDMGLGKTVQVLALIQDYKESFDNSYENIQLESFEKNDENRKRCSLIICPSSLILNWVEETNKFADDLKVITVTGTLQERENIIKNKMDDYDLAITSYDLLKRDIEFYKQKDYLFRYIIADEAQYIKNNTTQNARTIKEVKSNTRFALTGTPIENSLAELWSIFDFIMPGYLFTYNKFKINFETPIIKDEDEEQMAKLKNMIEPFILRRIKEKVLTELPDKINTILNNEMNDEQRKIYMSYLQRAKKEVNEEIELNGLKNSQMKILSVLMRLRQICCHPGLFIDNYEGESSKLNQCLEIVNDAVQGGHKILLFSGYSSMFHYVEKGLKELGIKYSKLTGQTKVQDRMDLVNEFNNNDEIKVFLISLKAGGTGLNLVSADMVIHYDPWWNISTENQATDRTYRIGQKRNVQVYKLITKNSIEEKIYNIQEKKAKLANTMLSTKQTFISKLSKDEIMNLFE